MVTVNVKQLVSAITETDSFKTPDMNPGTEYLYNNLYRRLSNGEAVMISSLDFGSFDCNDVAFLKDLCENVFEDNGYKANYIITALRQITPVCKAVGYV
jgi:hypothetical protein